MKEVAHILYGSQNYGLDTPESDRDYKVLLCHEFDDLYHYHKVCKDDLPTGLDPEHYSVMSVIQFHDLLMSGNPNCIEMIYSVDKRIFHDFYRDYLDLAGSMYAMGYIATVWDKFYSALKGIALNSIDRNGVNVKTVSRLCFFNYFAKQIVRDDFVVNERTWRNPKNFNYALAAAIRRSNKSTESLEAIADGAHWSLDINEHRFSAMAKAWCESNKESIKILKEDMQTLDRSIHRIVWECCYNARRDVYDHF